MRRSYRRIVAVAAFALLVTATQSVAAGEWADTEVFAGPDETAALIEQGATVVDAREASAFRRGHIPGATRVDWQDFVSGSTSGQLVEDDDAIEVRLREAGISGDRPVVVYGAWRDDGWGEEGRIHWMLEYLGHDDVRILAGGLRAWNRAGRPVAAGDADEPEAGDFTVDRREDRRISTDELKARLGDSESLHILDTRDPDEYDGAVKYGEQRGGHIPGADHLWWKELVDDKGLVDRGTVRERLDELGIEEGDTVVTYCTGGVRSGFVYAVLRAEGLDVRNYDASMWAWTRDEEAPVE